ncbi:MAG: hypothetical protein ACRDSP_14400 [Pseudonocardiaceae bacterium]
MLVALLMMAMPLFAVAGSSQAWACSCAGVEASAQRRDADVVFVGRVVERKEQREDPDVVSSDDPVIWTFQVDRVDKGSVQPQQDVVSALAEISCGYEFEVGRSYEVLAWRQPNAHPGQLSTDLCSGTRPVDSGIRPPMEPPTTSSPLASGRVMGRGGPDEGATHGGRLLAVGMAVAVGGAVTALVLWISMIRRNRRSSS